ncbi:hypothetical protein HY967_04685, partial [Candidatus Jorgensenbacteria bacterium]|nr:hypothetical protein [Candidatus Jorgensenbacteria bacterium]
MLQKRRSRESPDTTRRISRWPLAMDQEIASIDHKVRNRLMTLGMRDLYQIRLTKSAQKFLGQVARMTNFKKALPLFTEFINKCVQERCDKKGMSRCVYWRPDGVWDGKLWLGVSDPGWDIALCAADPLCQAILNEFEVGTV